MWRKSSIIVVLGSFLLGIAIYTGPLFSASSIELELIGRATVPSGVAEIAAYDKESQRLFVSNSEEDGMEIFDISDPSDPVHVTSVSIENWGTGINSVAVNRYGLVAVAVERSVEVSIPDDDDDDYDVPQEGVVVFFDAQGNFLHLVGVGFLPDMLTFTKNGRCLLVANEGEPSADYAVDPEGSVSIIKIPKKLKDITQASVQTVDFRSLNGQEESLDGSIRTFGPEASVAQDLEPEYIAISSNSKYAYVTLQENNAIAVIDIRRARLVDIFGLGYKDHSVAGNGMDSSDKDDTINIQTRPVMGLPMPDAIGTVRYRGRDILFTANEGDAREYDGFEEEEKVKDLVLDSVAFPDAENLQGQGVMGNLRVTTTMGDEGNDGDFEELYSFGTRSFSAYAYGKKGDEWVYDSGDDFEQITANLIPDYFNSQDGDPDEFDKRSDNKGPEPEGLAIGRFYSRNYAFICLERTGGVMVYDLKNPLEPEFVQYWNSVMEDNIDTDVSSSSESVIATDISPEGLLTIPRKDSPNKTPLVILSHEVSGTITILQANKVRVSRNR